MSNKEIEPIHNYNPPSTTTAVVRQEFAALEAHQQQETQATAIATRERAAVEARYLMAERHPRNIEMFRMRLRTECQRPGFAHVAEYARPVGGGKIAKGPSIRFIEAALRYFGNVFPEVVTVFDNDKLRICRVTVTDLEANLSYSSEIQIAKTVERKGYDGKPPKGRTVISERLNSQGDRTYLVEATDDEALVKQAALTSKAIRTLAQRLLPGDIVEECIQVTHQTKADDDAQDPETAKRAVIDAFAAIGVTPDDLEGYLGHPIMRIQVSELEELRAVFTAMKSGDTTWGAVMDAKNPAGSVEAAEDVAQVKLAKLRGKRAKKRPTPAAELATDAPDEDAGEEEPPSLSEAEMQQQTAEADAKPAMKLSFGRGRSNG